MKIAIAGCSGRMGLTLVRTTMADRDLQLTAGSERPGFNEKEVRQQLAAAGVGDLFITSNPMQLAERADAVIDFTAPEATLELAEALAKTGGVHIIGTTGMSDAQHKKLKTFAATARIVQSGNFSLGVTLLEKMIEQAATILDDSYDIEIFEMHHKHKKDAPSGTALMLGRAAAKGRGVELEDKKNLNHAGERRQGDIGFSVARGGDVVGVHSVSFAGKGEVIEFKHQGFSRNIYANGAIKAALWAKNQKPGLYSMRDVLGL